MNEFKFYNNNNNKNASVRGEAGTIQQQTSTQDIAFVTNKKVERITDHNKCKAGSGGVGGKIDRAPGNPFSSQVNEESPIGRKKKKENHQS